MYSSVDGTTPYCLPPIINGGVVVVFVVEIGTKPCTTNDEDEEAARTARAAAAMENFMIEIDGVD
jgi:hypothetical protein